MQIVECLETLILQVIKEGDHKEYPMMEKINSLCITSVTNLDTLQEIVEYLKVRMQPIREEMHMYVSYVKTLDSQQDIVEGIKQHK